MTAQPCPRCGATYTAKGERISLVSRGDNAGLCYNCAEEHANGHPRQPPNKPQPLPPPRQPIPIAQAPARYGGTWWAVCHLPTCYWIHQATNWDEAIAHLSEHTTDHLIGDPRYAP